MESKLELIAFRAAKHILRNKNLLITAGAGMGVDSGLPVFRGKEGLWAHYPYFKKTGMEFYEASSPHFFRSKPAHFWYYMGHRYNMYSAKEPHEGYKILLNICQAFKKENHFVFTSNVDGHFLKTGFHENKVLECHGSIHFTQCNNCGDLTPMEKKPIPLDNEQFIAKEIPTCPKCNLLLRPNILMFSDFDWQDNRYQNQSYNFSQFLQPINNSLTIIEFGAGTAVPTVRNLGENLLEKIQESCLIRVNLESEPFSITGKSTFANSINESNIDEAENKGMEYPSNQDTSLWLQESIKYPLNEYLEIKLSSMKAMVLIWNQIQKIMKIK